MSFTKRLLYQDDHAYTPSVTDAPASMKDATTSATILATTPPISAMVAGLCQGALHQSYLIIFVHKERTKVVGRRDIQHQWAVAHQTLVTRGLLGGKTGKRQFILGKNHGHLAVHRKHTPVRGKSIPCPWQRHPCLWQVHHACVCGGRNVCLWRTHPHSWQIGGGLPRTKGVSAIDKVQGRQTMQKLWL